MEIFGGEVSIPSRHLESRMAKDTTEPVEVSPALNMPTRKSVPDIVPAIVAELLVQKPAAARRHGQDENGGQSMEEALHAVRRTHRKTASSPPVRTLRHGLHKEQILPFARSA